VERQGEAVGVVVRFWGVMPPLSGFGRASSRQMEENQSIQWRNHFAEFKTYRDPAETEAGLVTKERQDVEPSGLTL